MNKQMFKRVVAFLLMAAVMVGLVFFRSENNYDKHYFRAKLARGQEVHCRIDLGKEGELKYLLQPNIYTLYLRLLPEDKQAQLRCEGEGLQLLLSRSSKKGLWSTGRDDEAVQGTDVSECGALFFAGAVKAEARTAGENKAL